MGGGRVGGGVKELGVGMLREEYIYMKILSTGDVFYSKSFFTQGFICFICFMLICFLIVKSYVITN